jgi:hypothetical protein
MEERLRFGQVSLELENVYFGRVSGVPLQGFINGQEERLPLGRVRHTLAQAEQGLAQVAPPLLIGAVGPEQGSNMGAGLRDALFQDEICHQGGDAPGGE